MTSIESVRPDGVDNAAFVAALHPGAAGEAPLVKFKLTGEQEETPRPIAPNAAQFLPDNGANYLSVSRHPHGASSERCRLAVLAFKLLTEYECRELDARAPASWIVECPDGTRELGYVIQPTDQHESVYARVADLPGAAFRKVIPAIGWIRLPVGKLDEEEREPAILRWQPELAYEAEHLLDLLATPKQPTAEMPSAFAKYSLRGHIEEVERLAVDHRPLLGAIAAQGQATCIYAPPNSGKTLIVLHLIQEAITSGRLDPDKLLYLNMDDNANGLIEKCRFADEYGFHMLADGFQNFSLSEFRQTLRETISNRTVNGSILVLDTLKKFVDTMSKPEARKFTNTIRKYVAQGGTVIALAHTNKNPDASGNNVYAGTTDIVDDFDCVYIVSRVANEGSSQAVAVFKNKKSRGGVTDTAAYCFATGTVSYSELLASVTEVDPEQWAPFCSMAEDHPDNVLIDAVNAAIGAGITSKMLIAAEVLRSTNASRQKAIRVIERYSQPGQPDQRWCCVRGKHGRHQYSPVTPAAAQ